MSSRSGLLRASLALTVAALVLGVAVPAVRAGGHSRPPLPTIVLVHGAFADASSWNPVVSRLQRQGYTVIAPADPLRGVASDSAYLASVLATIDGPIVLVGHSYGGAVITDAATGEANVKALVYVAAFAPDAGESLATISDEYPDNELGPSVLQRPYPGGVDLYVDPDLFGRVFAADLPRDAAALMAATQRPLAAAAFTEGSGPPAWRTIPSWYLVASNDRAIDPAAERAMAKRANSHTVEIRSSHVAMISHPDTVVRLITDAARAAG